MKIQIKDTIVETKEIISIKEYRRESFYNRHCGFAVELYKKPMLVFEWPIAYESYPREIAAIKDRCEKLMEEVILEWNKDRVVYPEEPPIKVFDMI